MSDYLNYLEGLSTAIEGGGELYIPVTYSRRNTKVEAKTDLLKHLEKFTQDPVRTQYDNILNIISKYESGQS